MGQKEIIDRNTYRKIKKMNRDELTKFILQYGMSCSENREK